MNPNHINNTIPPKHVGAQSAIPTTLPPLNSSSGNNMESERNQHRPPLPDFLSMQQKTQHQSGSQLNLSNYQQTSINQQGLFRNNQNNPLNITQQNSHRINQQPPYLYTDSPVSSQTQFSSHNTFTSDNTQAQWASAPSTSDILSPFEPLSTLPSSEHNLQALPLIQPSTTFTPTLLSPALTPKLPFSTISNTSETAWVLASAYFPPSPSVTGSSQPSPSRPSPVTVTKRRAVVDMAPPKTKRTRIILENEQDDLIEDDVEEDEWDDDNGNLEEEEEKEEEELVEGSEGYEKKLKTRDDIRFKDWMARKLNERAIYTALQTRNSGTTKKTPKARVYRLIMASFNKNPPDNIISFKQVNELQVKNKVDSIKKAFRKAHALVNKSGFSSQNGEGWRRRVKKKCRHYFDLKDNWSVAWTSDMPIYVDSLSNMDDEVITDDLPRQTHKGKHCAPEPIRDDNASDDLHDLTQDTDEWLSDGGQCEDLEPYLDNNLTGSTAVSPRNATPGPSRSATGPSRSAISLSRSATRPSRSSTPASSRSTPAVLQPLPNNTTSNNATVAIAGAGGHKDFAQLFLQGMESEKKAQSEKLTLKSEQFDFLKYDTESKYQLELKRLELESKKLDMETKKLEFENQRLLAQQKLDHELQLAQLHAHIWLHSRTVALNAELRNRGRKPVPFASIEASPSPTTSPHTSPHTSPLKSPRTSPSRSPPHPSS